MATSGMYSGDVLTSDLESLKLLKYPNLFVARAGLVHYTYSLHIANYTGD